MPIYMDYHIFPGVTVNDVKRAHMADKQTQAKYAVRYHQFWVNQDAGTIFCLIEGPSAEACAEVHREAHGNIACNLIEVESGLVDLFMGKDPRVEEGLVYNGEGEIDTGFRYIMVLDVIGKTKRTSHSELGHFVVPENPRRYARSLINKYHGKEVTNLQDDLLISVFNNAKDVLRCTKKLQEDFDSKLKSAEWELEYRIGVNYGQPVTMRNGLFSESIDQAIELSLIARDGETIISNNIKHMADASKFISSNNNSRFITVRQQEFLNLIFKHAQTNLSNNDYNMNTLSADVGVSRPQLYRKMVNITGLSPGAFFRGLKMHRALSLIKREKLNISEIALEVGFNNPSYFSKCFQERYGIMPSKVRV
jgi:AraC-like DNA-binding protein